MTGPGLIPLVRRWWWLILAAAAAAAMLAWAYASQEKKTYKADVKLLVGPVSADLPTVQASGALGRTYAELAHSRPLVVAAARQADVKLTPKEVENAVTASSNDVTRIVDVEVHYSNRLAAVKLAGAVATQLRRLKQRSPAESGDSVDAIMRDPGVVALPPDIQKTVRSAVVDVVGSPDVGNLTVVDAPFASRDPVAPKVSLIMVLAGLVGALLATGYALLHEGFAASRESIPYEEFEVETFMRAGTNGVSRASEEREPLEERSSRER